MPHELMTVLVAGLSTPNFQPAILITRLTPSLQSAHGAVYKRKEGMQQWGVCMCLCV